MSLTLEHCQVIKLHVPNGLLLRLEMGTNGKEDEVTEVLSNKIPKMLKKGRKEQVTVSHCSHIISGRNCE